MLKQLMTQLQTALQGAGLHPLPCEQAVKCLPVLIAQFENKPENRAGRRVRRAPRRRVCRTLKHLKRAATAGAQAGAAGREAHKLLRAIRTFPDFETLEKRAWVDAADSEGITLGGMVDLVAHCPEVTELLRKQRTCGATSSGKVVRRRFRRRRQAF